MYKHSLSLLIILLGFGFSSQAQNNYSISGNITDNASGEELIGATTFVNEIQRGTEIGRANV